MEFENVRRVRTMNTHGIGEIPIKLVSDSDIITCAVPQRTVAR